MLMQITFVFGLLTLVSKSKTVKAILVSTFICKSCKDGTLLTVSFNLRK